METAVVGLTLFNLLIFAMTGLTYLAAKQAETNLRHTFSELKETLALYRKYNKRPPIR
jgi:hypothetical protein